VHTTKRARIKTCPECHGEMERGYIPIEERGLQWSTKKHKWMADSLWQESVESLTGDTFRFYQSGNVPAYLCRNCKLVLAYYGNETRAIRKLSEFRFRL